jgi:hypothetical protein
MNRQPYKIVDWDPGFEAKALELDKMNVQGRNIQLEIIKPAFLDRAKVFDNYYSCLAITADSTLVGSAVAAQTKILVNEECINTGIGFDTKVHPGWRNQGVGRALAKNLYKNFFEKKGLSKNIMTAKQVNSPVHKMVDHTIGQSWKYPFVYLAIPTNIQVRFTRTDLYPQSFTVTLFEKEKIDPAYYTDFISGLGCFYTSRMYSIRIKKISWSLKTGIAFMKMLRQEKYTELPGENEQLFFATLYNHSTENIAGISEILETLQAKNIKQLMVCCQPRDPVYKALKKYSLGAYPYNLVSDFNIQPGDRLAIDARCL